MTTQDVDYAALICESLSARKGDLSAQFHRAGTIRYFVMDGLLCPDLARQVFVAFPGSEGRIVGNRMFERFHEFERRE